MLILSINNDISLVLKCNFSVKKRVFSLQKLLEKLKKTHFYR